MDRQIDSSVRQFRMLRRTAIGVAVLGFAWVAVAASLSWLRHAIKYTTLRTARVERGPIELGSDATGTVVPASERSLSSPIDARLLRVLKRAGSVVRAGEPLLELDTTAAQLQLERLLERAAQSQSQRLQLESQREQTLDGLRSQLEQRAAFDAELRTLRNENRSNDLHPERRSHCCSKHRHRSALHHLCIFKARVGAVHARGVRSRRTNIPYAIAGRALRNPQET